MDAKVKIAIIIALTILAMWLIKKIVEQAINLYLQYKEAKHPGTLPRKKSGVVLNKKTRKLENAAGELILPFN